MSHSELKLLSSHISASDDIASDIMLIAFFDDWIPKLAILHVDALFLQVSFHRVIIAQFVFTSAEAVSMTLEIILNISIWYFIIL